MRFVLAEAALLYILSCLPAGAEESLPVESNRQLTKPITAILADGRHISGRVAATTSDQQLDLVVTTERAQLTAHLIWTQVASIKIGDRQISVAGFRKRYLEFTLPGQPSSTPSSPPFRIEPLRHDKTNEPLPSSQSTPQSVQINTRLASWDQDAKPDGLLLELFVLGETGHPTVATGQLTAKLTGIRQAVTGGEGTRTRNSPVASLEQWSLTIKHSDFEGGRAVVQLPFRKLQPDRDLNIAAETLLEISYGVSSVGVFKASQPDVLIRHPSRFRDELFLSTGNRLLPTEAPANQTNRSLRRDPNREIFRPSFRVR